YWLMNCICRSKASINLGPLMDWLPTVAAVPLARPRPPVMPPRLELPLRLLMMNPSAMTPPETNTKPLAILDCMAPVRMPSMDNGDGEYSSTILLGAAAFGVTPTLEPPFLASLAA